MKRLLFLFIMITTYRVGNSVPRTPVRDFPWIPAEKARMAQSEKFSKSYAADIKPELIKNGVCKDPTDLPCCKKLNQYYERIKTEGKEGGLPDCRPDGYFKSKKCIWNEGNIDRCFCVNKNGEKGKDLPKIGDECP